MSIGKVNLVAVESPTNGGNGVDVVEFHELKKLVEGIVIMEVGWQIPGKTIMKSESSIKNSCCDFVH